MSASAIGQRASGKGEMPLFATPKTPDSSSCGISRLIPAARGVLNTILNAVLAQERTLARAAVHIPQLGADHLRTTLAACAALRQSVRALEAVACTRSLDWYTAVRHAPASDRLALWQAQWQQVQNQWEKMAKTLIPLMDNASVLESVYAQRSLALRPPPAGADGGIERQHRSIGRADCA